MSVSQRKSAESRVFRSSLSATRQLVPGGERLDANNNDEDSVDRCRARLGLCRRCPHDLTISASENGGPLKPVAAASGFGPSGNHITFGGAFLAAPDFTFSVFTAISKFGATQGELQVFGTIQDTGAPASLQLVIEENGYTMPAGPNYVMNGSLSYSSTSTGSLSFFSTANEVNSPGVSFPAPIAGSGNQNDTPTPFTSGSGYSITQTYNWGSALNGESLTLNRLGSTIVANAVPEPSSVVLFGLGSIGLFLQPSSPGPPRTDRGGLKQPSQMMALDCVLEPVTASPPDNLLLSAAMLFSNF